MLNKTKDHNANYLAKVVKIDNVRKHPSADRLLITTIDGNNVITGSDLKEGDLVIYFPLECSINLDYLTWSNSFEDKALNADKDKKGFFNSKGRVRALKLRKEPSQGYIIPISSLSDWLSSVTNKQVTFTEADANIEFDSYNDIQINKKYVNKQHQIGTTKNQAKSKSERKTVKQSKLVDNQFRLHINTAPLGKYSNNIKPDDVVSVTAKLHGTSAVLSYILVKKELTWLDKLFVKLGINIQDTMYDYVHSSRRVIKNQYYNDSKLNGGYYNSDIWGTVAKEINPYLDKGITVYGEIVGFLENGSCIQKDYDYGCAANKHDFYIYRITSTNPDGKVIEFSAKQIQEYCNNKGLKAVPELYYGYAKDLFSDLTVTEHWNEEFLNKLKETYLEKDDPLCNNKVPDEGIIVRREVLDIDCYKLKSHRFFERESAALDSGEINIEDEESNPL